MRIFITAAALMLAAPVAFAQVPTPGATQTEPQNPAIKGMHQNNSASPVEGANSFTQMQAQKQIEAKGYTHVAGLTKDQNGVWSGTAEKDGRTGPVTVDYQGNVN